MRVGDFTHFPIVVNVFRLSDFVTMISFTFDIAASMVRSQTTNYFHVLSKPVQGIHSKVSMLKISFGLANAQDEGQDHLIAPKTKSKTIPSRFGQEQD